MANSPKSGSSGLIDAGSALPARCAGTCTHGMRDKDLLMATMSACTMIFEKMFWV